LPEARKKIGEQVLVNAVTVQVDFRQFDFSGYATNQDLSEQGAQPEQNNWTQRPTGIPDTRLTQTTPPSKCSAVCQIAMERNQVRDLPSKNPGNHLARSLAIVPFVSID
jgi:hypothetical protein